VIDPPLRHIPLLWQRSAIGRRWSGFNRRRVTGSASMCTAYRCTGLRGRCAPLDAYALLISDREQYYPFYYPLSEVLPLFAPGGAGTAAEAFDGSGSLQIPQHPTDNIAAYSRAGLFQLG